jgi:SAM-dependent methyltransferase
MGKDGSKHHQKLAVPAVMDLLELKKGEQVLDIGAGQGVLAPFVKRKNGSYTGVDASERLIGLARQHHGKDGDFYVGDACRLSGIVQLKEQGYDAAVFLLSIQDMDPLSDALESASWALRKGGRVVLLMTHPAFRIPRQSGWGWDEGRKLQFRRVDSYLSHLPVPLKSYPGQAGVSRSFHRPISAYVNGLSDYGLLVDRMVEIPTYKVQRSGAKAKAENRANEEIPLFLGLRARKR